LPIGLVYSKKLAHFLPDFSMTLSGAGETRRVAAPSRPIPKIRGDAAELFVFPLRKGEHPEPDLARRILARTRKNRLFGTECSAVQEDP
jgi:hypothetical protein